MKMDRQQQGMTLIEVMISLVIGLILLAGVMALFANSRSTYDSNESKASMIDNGRFALQAIGYDLRLSGSYGPVTEAKKVSGRANSSNSLSKQANGDCANLFYIDVDRKIFASNGVNALGKCVKDYREGTDILTVRYASPRALSADKLKAQAVYVQSAFGGGQLFIGKNPPSTRHKTNVDVRSVVTHVYYISNNTRAGDKIPALHRISLQPGPKMVDEILASGIEDLQVQLGMSTCGKYKNSAGTCGSHQRYIGQYVNADNTQYFADEAWSNLRAVDDIAAVRIALLARNPSHQSKLSKKERTYQYGNVNRTFKDGIHRMLFSGTFKIRNHSS